MANSFGHHCVNGAVPSSGYLRKKHAVSNHWVGLYQSRRIADAHGIRIRFQRGASSCWRDYCHSWWSVVRSLGKACGSRWAVSSICSKPRRPSSRHSQSSCCRLRWVGLRARNHAARRSPRSRFPRRSHATFVDCSADLGSGAAAW